MQQTDLLAGIINEQDCRAIRTAYCCLRSLRIRVEARANVFFLWRGRNCTRLGPYNCVSSENLRTKQKRDTYGP